MRAYGAISQNKTTTGAYIYIIAEITFINYQEIVHKISLY
jgi:hypothetical protein